MGKRGVLGIVAVAFAVASHSAAGRPQPMIQQFRFENEIEVIPAGALCDFPVTVASSGHFRVAVHFNKDGSVRRIMQNPSLVTTFSANGKSFTSPDRGLDKMTLDEDAGTVTVHGTGIHLRVKGEFVAIGLWVLTFDMVTGELLSAEYHGNFDGGIEEGAAFICSKLA
jgi:hypothetical protein